MSRQVTTLFGPPGTGKTTRLLSTVEKFLQSGGRPERIAFCAFTRKAASEASWRAQKRFSITAEDLPYFRTLHSIAFRSLDMTSKEVMDKGDWEDFGKMVGLPLEKYVPSADSRPEFLGASLAERILACYGLARARQRSVEEEWAAGSWSDLPLWSVQQFAQDLAKFKLESGKSDFTDFLDHCDYALDVDLFILDEAQDLTPQQWTFARKIARNAKSILIAGDDDQAIYDWSGADSSQMRKFRGDRVVLPISYRLPKSVYRLSSEIIGRVRDRVPKTYSPRDEEGVVGYEDSIDSVDMSEGEWLILSRANHSLRSAERYCRQNGFVYQVRGEWSNQTPAVRAAHSYEKLRKGEQIPLLEARTVAASILNMPRPTGPESLGWLDLAWVGPAAQRLPWYDALTRLGDEEVAYIRALLRRGESSFKSGRIVLSTIHGAKGGEADNVALITSSPRRVQEVGEASPDSENRVWYVGATRAKNKLLLVGNRSLSF